MNENEKFEAWRKRTCESIAEVEKTVDIIYRQLCISFDATTLKLLYRSYQSLCEMREVYESECELHSIKSAYDNPENKQ